MNTFDMIVAHKLIRKIFDDESVTSDEARFLKLTELIRTSKKIHKFIPKSKYNTDNAWIEYTAINYHDIKGDFFHNIQVKVILILSLMRVCVCDI